MVACKLASQICLRLSRDSGCVASTFMLTGLYMNVGRVILKIDSEEAD